MTLTLSDDDKLAIAARFAATSRSNDADGYLKLCAADARTWHNFDELEVSAEQTVKTVAWLHRTVRDLAWRDVAVYPTASGFVSQTIMTGDAAGGELPRPFLRHRHPRRRWSGHPGRGVP